ncbi:glycine betaine ABC transporter substrate-binding protein [Spiribacter aquaticus]|uniref:Glycine betaine ABC transporter substrate-binding protein n=2 Tax=Spiribacter TaxID=1335745 RepID=A0A557RHC7_9GAMM|nr:MULTISPECIES: glycine betaine ABC transporter substrate-binding protein [Spiribacter]PZA00197.1 glycine/betaine ABC transporter substrate-binding protein [Gammaproteobacteria bacterium 2W06]AUB78770.1 glycine/betaine ABC transporter substrate-binding protein [Spiribacter roseus]KAF0280715.1 glycine/betaine ABC transporter substrate-binding protein [Spiribacter roseus]KAF0281504.1 glycine/betaine ABC transporter substrate-binding protein [Spiribacter roseus]KAF0285381.1 glycine/betaine ABC t
MLRQSTRLLVTGALGMALAGGAQAQDDTIEIGWTAWSDAEFVTKLASRLINENTDHTVELVQTDIAPQYQGIETGDIDAMMMAWLPATHEDYYEEIASNVENLGVLYNGARLGWVVPDYIPESQLSSLSDLSNESVRDKLDGRITGIDPGAGLTQLSESAIEEYELDGYNLQTSSGAGMTAALDRATNREEWVVVTGWSPHWKFGAYDLRYLEDPQGVLGGPERVHVLARAGFDADYPQISQVLTRMYLSLDELQGYMFEARESSYDEAISQFIDENPDQVNYWLTGEF